MAHLEPLWGNNAGILGRGAIIFLGSFILHAAAQRIEEPRPSALWKFTLLYILAF